MTILGQQAGKEATFYFKAGRDQVAVSQLVSMRGWFRIGLPAVAWTPAYSAPIRFGEPKPL